MLVLRDLIEGVGRRLSTLPEVLLGPVVPLLDTWEQDLTGPWESFLEADELVAAP